MPVWTATLDIFDEVTRLARSIRRRAWPHMTKPLARLAREIIVQRSRGRPPSTRRMNSSAEARSHGRGAPVLLNRPLEVKARLNACHVLGDVRGRRGLKTCAVDAASQHVLDALDAVSRSPVRRCVGIHPRVHAEAEILADL